MHLTFLEADVPLTKRFSLVNGQLEKSSYPLIGRFTSHTADVESIEQFHEKLTQHADAGHCLLKGVIKRKLNNESRAGSTDGLTETQWMVFDFDNVEGVTDPDVAIRLLLPREFHNVSYVMQYSASAGIAGEAGLRAHVFFMLSEPTLPDNIKLWTKQLNLDNPMLARNLGLSANGFTLKYSLDITCNQNDKLIYIAPPVLDGVDDPHAGRRIQLVRKDHDTIDFNQFPIPPAHALQNSVDELVADMREDLNLPKHKAKYRIIDGEQVLANPTIGQVTGEKIDRNWVRINLAGEGPTWGYYYDAQNPKLLYSFKGHPPVMLKDFLPEYFAQVQARMLQQRAAHIAQQPIRPFVFRHLETDTYYNGLYDQDADRIIKLAKTSGGRKMKDFFAQYGQQPPAVIEDWAYEFRPDDDRQMDFAERFCNSWTPTDIYLNCQPQDNIPPLVDQVIRHVVAYDERAYKHFINWLACIFQYRKKLLTSWVFHGVQGTGKGVLFTHILVPIFGEKHCVTKLLTHMEDQFNADFEHALIYNVDEIRVSNSRNQAAMMDKLKAMITEPFTSIRAMRTDPRMVPNFANFIFTSNSLDAMGIEPKDRRFNVAPRQENRINFTQADVATLRAQIQQFAGFLRGYKADLTLAGQALENDAKVNMQQTAMEAVEQIIDAVVRGDLQYFVDYLEEGIAPNADALHWQNFHATVKNWVRMGDTPTVIGRNDLMAVYAYLVGDNKSARSPHKFSKMLEHKNIRLNTKHYSKFHSDSVRGLPVTWKVSELQLAGWMRNQKLQLAA